MAQNNPDSELVIGLISRVGVDQNEVISCLTDFLKHYNYETELIKVSTDIIAKLCGSINDSCEYTRLDYYMTKGDELRKKYSADILMKGIVSNICLRRENDENGGVKPKDRVAYIIKSIKHPEEVKFLRTVYGDGFHLIGISATKEEALSYLKRKKMTPEQAQLLIDRDEGLEIKYGQQTQKTFQEADYFLINNSEPKFLENSIARLIDLMFGHPYIMPTFDEYAMFMAYASSLSSADLSRQVGAVITKQDEIIAHGFNDCPKAQGGLYWTVLENGEYSDVDNGRDYKRKIDSNKEKQFELVDSIIESLDLKKLFRDYIISEKEQEISETDLNIEIDKYIENSKDNIKTSALKDITEYGRVVHAEMEAITMCARNNISCRDAFLFVTTFPCHNCAKHIISSGIKKVIYIEPYPKSKTFEFYTKEITTSEKGSDKKVIFKPFIGVGPHKFMDLFSMNSTKWGEKRRKDKITARTYDWDSMKGSAQLRSTMSRISYLDLEFLTMEEFNDITKDLGGDLNDD